MARYKRQGTPSYIGHESSSPELELIGGKLFKETDHSPSVLDYHGAIYQHDQLLSSPNSGNKQNYLPLGSPSDDGYRNPAPSPEGYSLDQDTSPTIHDNARYPSPPSRPQSGLFEKHKPLPGIGQGFVLDHDAWATNVDGQQRRGLFKKSSPGMEYYGDDDYQYNMSPRLATDLDPDCEPISDVLSRLGDYAQNCTRDSPLACIKCECDSGCSRRTSGHSLTSSDSEEDSSGSQEGEGVSVSVLLKMLQQYEEKGHSSVRYKAMTTLLQGYTGQEVISTEQLQLIMSLLKTSSSDVQNMCLMMLRYCAKSTENVQKLLDSAILDFLYDCVAQPRLSPLAGPALQLLEVVFSCDDVKVKWLDAAVTMITPVTMKLLRGNGRLEVKYAACCMFKALAKHEEFIGTMTDDVLPVVVQLRNASIKCKQVYAEILTCLLSHTDCVPRDLLDSSAIPVTASVITDGPCSSQCAALSLLVSLTSSVNGVAMVIGANNLVPLILCCMKESRCRNVRLAATDVMKQLCTTRKLGLCKDLMLQLSSYFVPSHDQESLASLHHMVVSPGGAPRPKFDEAQHMWLGIERFMDMTVELIYTEGKVEVDKLGVVIAIHMKPCVDTCDVQLGLLSSALDVLQDLCLWPLDRSRLGFGTNKLDLTTFTDDEKQRAHLSKVNRGLTQAVWDKTGTIITEFLFAYAQKFKTANEGNSTKGRQLTLENVFEPHEVKLVQSMLELLLCSAISTCVVFPEIIPKLQNQSKKTTSSHSKLKSSSTSHVQNGTTKSSQVQARLKSQSDVGSRLNSQDKVWVSENPHLTSMRKHREGEADQHKAELQEKEACTERRLLRKCPYEAGVFSCVCPFLQSSDRQLQVLVLQIIRCLIQPLEEKVSSKLHHSTRPPPSNGRQRPQTAMTRKDADKGLNSALLQMSPDIADLIKAALGPRAPQGDKGTLSIPKASRELDTIHERLQEFTEANPVVDQPPANPPPTEEKLGKPVFDRFRPVAQQCREALMEEIGELILQGIFNRDEEVKKRSVLLLHDLIEHGDLDTHMRLSSLGCMPKLVDFLRVNEDDELLEITGLIIVRILINSDSRLKNLFNRHGGSGLLIAMAGYTSGLLKQEVASTLKTVSRVDTPTRKRPASAPVTRAVTGEVVSKGTGKPADIWDHIQARWNQEDQVVGVLRQWMP